ncbi:MAG TPA: hypothetical protein PK095_00040 [Myxococcota bacterium]|nr:hypothetical protein [Myxococcota bacterium]
MSPAGKLKVWLVWAETSVSEYERQHGIVEAFETRAQAYARKERLERKLASAKRRVERYLEGEATEPPKHHGAIGKIVADYGVNARVWVHPLAVTRGTRGGTL